jgi:hopanoid biosynthesis associated protein HpnK
MKRLIINADDFGWSPEVNRGILKCHEDGILTSTTLLMNGPALDDAVKIARASPTLGVGVHMNIVRGTPLSDPARIPTLVGTHGKFMGSAERVLLRMMLGRIAEAEIRIEIEAQVSRFKEHLGAPTHVDSEKHMHAFVPFSSAAIAIAGAHNISTMRCPMETQHGTDLAIMQRFKSWLLLRSAKLLKDLAKQANITTPDSFVGIVDTGRMTGERYRKIFDSTEDGVTEVMTHPGYVSKREHEDFPSGFIKDTREIEMKGLLETGLKEYAAERNIELIHFGEV